MPNDPAPDGGNPPPADPNSDPNTEPAPSDPPAPESDIERLRKSKDKWKADALEKQAKLDKLEADEKARKDKEMEEQGQLKELAEQRRIDLEAEKAKSEAAQKELDEIENDRKAELETLLKDIPEDKKPPLDDSMTTKKKLEMVRYSHSLLNTGPKPPVGGQKPKSEGGDENAKRLKELRSKPHLTDAEAAEEMELSTAE
ncbi:hypothetical protein [Blastopirellula marina]|nr:hypothetical protein [Blastopirellula marina]